MYTLAPLFPELYTAILITGIAGLMRGFAGFGSGMLMAPIFAILFGPVEAVSTIILLEIFATLQLFRSVKEHIEWRFVGVMGLVAVAFMPIGTWLLVSLDPLILIRASGVIVLSFVIVLLSGWRYEGHKKTWVTMGIGAFSGTMMAATSLGNPVVMIYMLTGRDNPETNRSNITAYFTLTLSALLIYMSFSGLMTKVSVLRAMTLVPVFMLTTWFGSYFFHRSNEFSYRIVALIFLFCASIVGLVG